ncbi:hypothetical protein M1N54_00125 [Thermodesulfovibrionales bacterium]|nr:hypothetical protein [Thermodesulfovibrionales bacterium]
MTMRYKYIITQTQHSASRYLRRSALRAMSAGQITEAKEVLRTISEVKKE